MFSALCRCSLQLRALVWQILLPARLATLQQQSQQPAAALPTRRKQAWACRQQCSSESSLTEP